MGGIIARLAIVTLLLAPAPRALATCADPLLMGWEPWPPFQIPAKPEPTGIDIEIVEAIAEEMGCTVVFKQRPWKRILLEIESGRLDMTTHVSYTSDRDAYGRYSDEFMNETMKLFVRPGIDQGYASVRAFLEDGKRLAVTGGYTYGRDTDRLIDTPAYRDQISRVRSPRLSVRMLAARHVDGALGNRFVIPHLADEEGVAPEIMQTSVVVNRKPVYVLFSDTRTPEAEVAAFNAALARIRRDGTYDKILSRYIFGGES